MNECYSPKVAEQRFFRTIVLGGAALVGGTTLSVICGSCSDSGGETPDAGCQFTARFQSTCPIESISTNCTGGSVSCDDGGVSSCKIGSQANPVIDSCTISVVLTDGTQATVQVHVTKYAGCDDTFVSPFTIGCSQPDASSDAETGTTDATADANENGDASDAQD